MEHDKQSTAVKSEDTIVVEIFGKSCRLRSAADEKYVKKIARFVDKRMREVNEAITPRADTEVAILAALNITDELFESRSETSDSATDLQNRAHTLLMRLEEKLPELEATST